MDCAQEIRYCVSVVHAPSIVQVKQYYPGIVTPSFSSNDDMAASRISLRRLALRAIGIPTSITPGADKCSEISMG
jgi:hypothetical protein